MTLIARKSSSAKQDRLRRFVAQHIGALEPGLQVVEAGLRLGRMVVDLVAADSRQTLVLIAVGPVATDRMLIGMLDAYIWCLQFPDGLRRLCPEAPITFTRPPRLVVVAEEVPESFMDLVGCLSLEVECHELAREASPEPAVPPASHTDVPSSDAPMTGSPLSADAVAAAAADRPGPATPMTHPTLDAAPVVTPAATQPATGDDALPGAADRKPEAETAVEPAETTATPAHGEPGVVAADKAPSVPGQAVAEEVRPAEAPTPAASALPPSPFARNGRRPSPPPGVPRPAAVNGGLGEAGRRGYAFAQAARQPHVAEPVPSDMPAGEPEKTDHARAAMNGAAGSANAHPPAAPSGVQPEPGLEPLLSSSGVSRQWQEFLARLASAQ
ncbi:MAG TPA: hypothetical protein VNK50_07850 [Calidithermus sp.]|nr:hypothetical protein [Calidithermus sp.]